MKRRAFITLLGGIAAWPLLLRAQPLERVRRVGVLLSFAESDPEANVRIHAFDEALRDLGWIDGYNIRIEYRFAAGDVDRALAFASEFVDLPVDAIVTNIGQKMTRGPTIPTQTIPIVFAMVHSLSLAEPEYIVSPAHPSRNVTGLTTFEPSIVGKWMELLAAIAPNVRRIYFIFNPDASQTYRDNWLLQFDSAARSFAVEPTLLRVRNLAELRSTVATLGQKPHCGLLMLPDTFTVGNYASIVALARGLHLPACYPYRYFTTEGGLMSYGPNGAQVFRQAASYIDRILRGAKAGDLPIQQPNAFELVINLKIAKSMGLAPPAWLLARADEVIE
jgi:putative tryptophan/tyrosine transport system substrate-binding protein